MVRVLALHQGASVAAKDAQVIEYPKLDCKTLDMLVVSAADDQLERESSTSLSLF
jgi:hypothetical protein